jgi:hypothetical protein
MTIEINDAQQYAETIANELRQLDDVLRDPDGALLTELFGDYNEEDLTSGMDVLAQYLNQYACDLSVRRDTRGADYGSTIEITRTIGGPGCWVRRDTEDGATIEVVAAWGSSRGHVTLWLYTLAGWLDELASIM